VVVNIARNLECSEKRGVFPGPPKDKCTKRGQWQWPIEGTVGVSGDKLLQNKLAVPHSTAGPPDVLESHDVFILPEKADNMKKYVKAERFLWRDDERRGMLA
jgi:hypothetical protein